MFVLESNDIMLFYSNFHIHEGVQVTFLWAALRPSSNERTTPHSLTSSVTSSVDSNIMLLIYSRDQRPSKDR